MASRKGVEPLTCGLGNRRSIPLSYRDFRERPVRPRGSIGAPAYFALAWPNSACQQMRDENMRLRHAGKIRGIGLCLAALMAVEGFCTRVGAQRAAMPRQSACPAAGESRAAIVHIDENLEITLKDGRTLRLAGLEPARPTPDQPDFDATARDTLGARLGGAIAFTPLAQRPDRWGRTPVFAFFDQAGAEPASVGEFLLAPRLRPFHARA